MSQVDLSVLREGYNVTAIIDKDPESDKSRQEFKHNCREYGIKVTRLKRRAIENYFTLSAIRQVLRRQRRRRDRTH